MNGELLDPNHGYPLRLFAPGRYGVASVKWLRRIEVVNKPFRGYFQSVKYTVQRRTERGVETEVVGPMMPKSEIIRPRDGDVLGLGGNRFFGVSWAGEESVSRVDVSTDGGATWNDATLVGPQAPTRGRCGSISGRPIRRANTRSWYGPRRRVAGYSRWTTTL